MEASLPSYRLFNLNPESGKRDPGEWLDAADDGEALKRAGELASQGRCEVWLQTKLVGIVLPSR